MTNDPYLRTMVSGAILDDKRSNEHEPKSKGIDSPGNLASPEGVGPGLENEPRPEISAPGDHEEGDAADEDNP